MAQGPPADSSTSGGEETSRLRRLGLSGEIDSAAVARWLFIAVWAASALNAVHYLGRGWLPHDVGTLGEPAVRVLRGQWPHRDFEDTYTGGLALLDALGFRLLAVNAMTLRWIVLAVYLAWVPAVWYLARRLTGPVLAALATLLAAAWTLPMYAEGMPSWYNLFLATFGAAALFRWIEVRRRRWLFVSGLAGGLSILVKVSGLYYVAGVLLYLLYETFSSSGSVEGAESRSGTRAYAYRGWVLSATLALSVLVAALVVRAMGPVGLLRFGVPAVAPAAVLSVWLVRRRWAGPSTGWRGLVASLTPFALGVALPLAAFAAPYAAVGALGRLYRGVFVLPARRFSAAHWEGRWGDGLGAGLAFCGVLWLLKPPRRRGALEIATATVVGALLLGALAASSHTRVYLALWGALWWLPPWVGLVGAMRVMVTATPTERDRKLFALFSIWGLVSLVEIPFAAPIYFFFSAPLLVMVALALGGDGPPRRRRWLLVSIVFLLGFTVWRLNPGFIRNLGYGPAHDVQSHVLALPRSGGLRVDSADAHDYETLVAMVDALARGPYIYATPDCPEVYFLSGKRNPTPILYEFLDPARNTPARILDALDRAHVRVVVINRDPYFSAPIAGTLITELQKRYPLWREVGRFLVVWKAPGALGAPPSAPAGAGGSIGSGPPYSDP